MAVAGVERVAAGTRPRQAEAPYSPGTDAGSAYSGAWKTRFRTGRPSAAPEVRTLIRRLAAANPLWGAPRIHAELQKLGISVSQAIVAKYMPRRDTPPSQPWRTFLANHVGQIMAADFFVVDLASLASQAIDEHRGLLNWNVFRGELALDQE